MNKRQKLFTVFLAIIFMLLLTALIYSSLRVSQTNKTLNDKIQQLQIVQPQNGHTPTNEELLALIRPLIPPPVSGANGNNGVNGSNGANGTNGSNGKDAPPAQSCTTYTDENNDSYVACPDGTKTLIQQPDQPRQIELCSTPTIPLGWRYVGTTFCQKVKGS